MDAGGGPAQTRPMTVVEMQTALRDMKMCIDTQSRSNEKIWEHVQESREMHLECEAGNEEACHRIF